MDVISHRKRRLNWMLSSFVGISAVIHLFIFMHITDLYNSKPVTYIELTLKDISKPTKRSIPRPRFQTKTLERPQEVIKPKVTSRPTPRCKPIRVGTVEPGLPESLVGRIHIPNVKTPSIPRLNVSGWAPDVKPLPTQDQDQTVTKASYLEIVKLKIESLKRYPKAARVMEIEGRVTISFIILPIGKAESIKVVKSSKFDILDTAALKAVKDASPFPKPPVRLFRGKIPLKITIVFDLT